MEAFGSAWGLEVRTVASAMEALDACSAGPFDLIVADYRTAFHSGVQLPKMMCARMGSQVPFIVTSSQEIEASEVDSSEAASVLHKPLKPAAFFAAMVHALEGGSRQHRPQQKQEGYAIDHNLAARYPLRILVAEDHSMNQRVIKLTLAKMGYTADMAADGEEALNALRRQPYDLILMDVEMPKMSGLEACRRIREAYAPEDQPRIVAFTANALQEQRELLLREGMDGCIVKPAPLSAIREAIVETHHIKHGRAR